MAAKTTHIAMRDEKYVEDYSFSEFQMILSKSLSLPIGMILIRLDVFIQACVTSH